jgi:hypothetical protein
MKTRTRILAFLTLIIKTCNCSEYIAQAQDNFSVTNFTTRDGVPNNHINDLNRDRTGFLLF